MKRRRCAILPAVQQAATDPAVEEELSLDEEFLLAVIRQRFGWLTDLGCDPGEALLMATLTRLSLPTALRCLRPDCSESLATPLLRRVAYEHHGSPHALRIAGTCCGARAHYPFAASASCLRAGLPTCTELRPWLRHPFAVVEASEPGLTACL